MIGVKCRRDVPVKQKSEGGYGQPLRRDMMLKWGGLQHRDCS